MDDGAAWWRSAVIYQIYPRSYQDSNGDGVGDLPGITARLDHLAWLGVDAVWLSPIYPSPFEDGGYDVSDYTDVHPMFGDLSDFDALVSAAHERDLRIILDYVPNHTSRHHPWFVDARTGRDAAHRDDYIWRDPGADGGPPNNWRCLNDNRAGSAWNFDDATGQYFLATFSPVQPDLNWSNLDVRSAMADVLRFWLDRGVDGFRIDMVGFLAKDPRFGDEPLPEAASTEDYVRDARHHFNRPEAASVVRDLRRVVDEYADRVVIGEMIYEATTEQLVTYARDAGVDLPANFRLITLPFEAEPIARHLAEYDAATAAAGVWPNYCLANHDMPRPSRLGPQGARLAMVLLLTLRGTPFVYYGDEIGMPNVEVPPDLADDPWPASIGRVTRDAVRTPMRWDASSTAGFCLDDVAPWLPIGDDVDRVNVEAQHADPSSLLHLTRAVLGLRRQTLALTVGDFAPLRDVPGDCIGFARTSGDQRVVVLANLGAAAASIAAAEHLPTQSLLATGDVKVDDAGVELGSWSAVILASL